MGTQSWGSPYSQLAEEIDAFFFFFFFFAMISLVHARVKVGLLVNKCTKSGMYAR